MRRCLPSVLFAMAMTVSVPALAQDCPPGAWFCEEVAPPPAASPRDPSRPRPQTQQVGRDDVDDEPDVDVDSDDEAPPPPPVQVEVPRRNPRPVIVVPQRPVNRGRPPIVIYRGGVNV